MIIRVAFALPPLFLQRWELIWHNWAFLLQRCPSDSYCWSPCPHNMLPFICTTMIFSPAMRPDSARLSIFSLSWISLFQIQHCWLRNILDRDVTHCASERFSNAESDTLLQNLDCVLTLKCGFEYALSLANAVIIDKSSIVSEKKIRPWHQLGRHHYTSARAFFQLNHDNDHSDGIRLLHCADTAETRLKYGTYHNVASW